MSKDTGYSIMDRMRPLDEILSANLPALLSPEEKLIWLLGDLMNAAENYFGAENPKRLGHINSSAIRILDEIIEPLRSSLYKEERLREARSNQPDWEKFWAEASEENDRLRTLLREAARFYPRHDHDPRVNLVGVEIQDVIDGQSTPLTQEQART